MAQSHSSCLYLEEITLPVSDSYCTFVKIQHIWARMNNHMLLWLLSWFCFVMFHMGSVSEPGLCVLSSFLLFFCSYLFQKFEVKHFKKRVCIVLDGFLAL